MKNKKHSLVGEGYWLPFVLITFFFFLWGFARAILDVLNPFFQETFQMNKTQASWIQFVTYLAYFLMAVPAGLLIRKFGTRHGVVVGLIAFGGAALAFVLSRFFGDYIFWYYLFLLFVIGCGLACLEVAANPYVTLLGRPETAASRINRAQSFNGMGCIFGSLLGGAYCFSNDDPNISVPYIFIGIAVLLVAVLFSRVKLPEFVADGNDEEYDAARKVSGDRKIPPGTARNAAAGYAPSGSTAAKSRGLRRHPVFVFGLFALFCYEIAEIAINSFFINYATENHMAEWINTFIVDVFHTTLNYNFISSIVLSAGLFLFMCGRFAGSWIMRFVRAEVILLCCATATVLMTTLVVLDIHIVSFVASVLIFLFESIMFPTIFALSIKGLGPLTQKASAVLMMTPIGGAAGAVLMGMAADYRDMTFSFLVPLAAFVVIWAYATVVCRKKTKTKPVAPTVNIMSLEFFAQHFNFLVEDLQWGIAEVIKDGEIMYVNCAVLVKEKSLYIAISEGKIRPCVNCCIVSFNLIPCEVHEEDNKFIFASKGYRISIRRESIHEFYADRVYSSDTNTYLLGAFADYD